MLENIDNFVWGPFMLTFLLFTGAYLMVKMRFLPVRNLGKAIKMLIGKGKRHSTGLKGDISEIESLTTELAATIGTGNIVGVATAMGLVDQGL